MSDVELSSLRARGQAQTVWKFAAALGHTLARPMVALPVKITGLAVPIRPLLAGTAEAGVRIYHGNFCFHGKQAHSRGGMIFDAPATDESWLAELHGFSWLADLEATGLELGRRHARALIWDWVEKNRYRQPGANAVPVVARRLMSWILAAPFLMPGAEQGFVGGFYSALASHVRDLQLRSAIARSRDIRLDCAIALAFAAVALKGLEASRPSELQQLSERLDTQIFPDGGHVGRNPADLVRLLLDLIPLRLACEEARIEIPPKVHAAIERMLPMLRFFMHGDGGLAMFQGVSDPLVRECRAILEADVIAGRPLSNAVYSRYARLAHGDSVVICDTGLPADEALNPMSACAPLAFEFSDAACRVVINCGAPISRKQLMAVARLGDAHSTAAPANPLKHPASLPVLERLGLAGEKSVRTHAEANTSPLGSIIEACHSAFQAQTGHLHERRLFLSASGGDFRGEDRFIPVCAVPGPDHHFLIRFHLHPAVRATLSMGGASVVLLLPSKVGWTFSARGADIALEESICLWGKAGPRKTTQIVLTGCTAGQPVIWAFKRCRERPASADQAASSAALPL